MLTSRFIYYFYKLLHSMKYTLEKKKMFRKKTIRMNSKRDFNIVNNFSGKLSLVKAARFPVTYFAHGKHLIVKQNSWKN